jgi:hypothetical protein
MTNKALIKLLETLPKDLDVIVGFDSNLGQADLTGKYEIRKVGADYKYIFLLSN